MTQKQVQQVDILVTKASVDSAQALTKAFADQAKEVTALLQSLQLVDKQLKALKSAQIAATPGYVKGAAASQETQVQKTAITADQKRIQAYKDLLKLDQDRSALLMSQSRMLDEEGKRVRKTTDLEQLALNLKAAQFRAKEAQLKQDDQAQAKAQQLVRIFQKRIDQINAETKAKEAALKRERDALAALDRSAKQISDGQAQREKQREKKLSPPFVVCSRRSPPVRPSARSGNSGSRISCAAMLKSASSRPSAKLKRPSGRGCSRSLTSGRLNGLGKCPRCVCLATAGPACFAFRPT